MSGKYPLNFGSHPFEAELRRRQEMLNAVEGIKPNALKLYEQAQRRFEEETTLRNRLDITERVQRFQVDRESLPMADRRSPALDLAVSSPFLAAQRMIGYYQTEVTDAVTAFAKVPDWITRSPIHSEPIGWRAYQEALPPSIDALSAMRANLSFVVGSAAQAWESVSRLDAGLREQAVQFSGSHLLLDDAKAISGVADYASRIDTMLARSVGKAASLVAPLDEFASVVASYRDVHSEFTIHIMEQHESARFDALRFVTPTATVRSYGQALHEYASIILEENYSASDDAPHDIGDLLDSRLAEIGDSLVALRCGARDALASRSRDKIRQATHSSRELLRAVLEALAPTEAISAKEKGRPTRKERVYYLFRSKSKSLSAYVDSQANAINELYARLSDLSHTGKGAELSALCAINACEALLLNIFVELESQETE